MKSIKAYVKDALYYRYFQYTEAATRGVLCKKVFLEISQNSQENACASTLREFLSQNKRLWHRRYPVKFLGTPSLQNTSERRLLCFRK